MLLTRKTVYNPLICDFRYTCCRWHRNELTDVANNLRHWWLILFFVMPRLTFAILFVLVLRVFLHVNVVLHHPFYASLESLRLTFKSLRNKLFYTSVQDLWSILKEKSEWTLQKTPGLTFLPMLIVSRTTLVISKQKLSAIYYCTHGYQSVFLNFFYSDNINQQIAWYNLHPEYSKHLHTNT